MVKAYGQSKLANVLRYVNYMSVVGIEKPYFPASVIVSYAATGDEQ